MSNKTYFCNSCGQSWHDDRNDGMCPYCQSVEVEVLGVAEAAMTEWSDDVKAAASHLGDEQDFTDKYLAKIDAMETAGDASHEDAKRLRFALVYGLSPKDLRKDLGLLDETDDGRA